MTVVDGAAEELAAPHAAEPVGGGLHDRAGRRRSSTYLAAVAGRPRRGARRRASTKAVIAREIAVDADRPIDRHGVLHRLKASFGSSYRYAIDGFIGASPELLVEVDGHDVRARTRWPARRRAPATSTATPRSPPRSSPARRTRSSTAS